MHLLSYLPAVLHHSDVAGDDSRDARLVGGIDNLAHQRQVFTVDNGVDRQIALHAVLFTLSGNVAQVIDGEC